MARSIFTLKKISKRIISKNGECNVVMLNVAKRKRRFLQDIFTTLVDVKWRWTMLVFILSFCLSWLFFSILWWMIFSIHGDLLLMNIKNPHWEPCATNIFDFTSCFLFSIETQHTIGYGTRMLTEECPQAIILMCLQSIIGVMAQAFMVGVVFTKLSKPKKRTQTLLFSKHSVICHRDGVPCLMFRVGDMRKSHIIEAHIRAQIIKHRITSDGEHLPFSQTDLKVYADNEEGKLFFIWPTIIIHRIDETSPLYHLTPEDLMIDDFEIVVILGGVIESTGLSTQARSSYIPSEIVWGYKFKHMVNFSFKTNEFEVDYSLFDDTEKVDIPKCSAEEFNIQQKKQDDNIESKSLLAPSNALLFAANDFI